MTNQRKTLVEHVGFVESAARLSFFFAFRLKPHLPEETLGHILLLCMKKHPEIPLWHLGDWEKIVTAKGLFNEKTGNHVPEHDGLRYRMRSSCCSLANPEKHLKGMLA